MCRLIVFRRHFLGHKELIKFFHRLEYAGGGDGNGVLLFTGKRYYYKKGVDLSVEDIVNLIESVNKYKWVVFHTRRVSAGAKSFDNTHPFFDCVDGKCISLSMNGHFESFDAWRIIFGLDYKASDTRTLFEVLKYLVTRYPVEDAIMRFSDAFGYYGTYIITVNRDVYVSARSSWDFEISFKKSRWIAAGSQDTDKLVRGTYKRYGRVLLHLYPDGKYEVLEGELTKKPYYEYAGRYRYLREYGVYNDYYDYYWLREMEKMEEENKRDPEVL